MSKTKLLTSLLLAMAVLFAQVGMVAAAPQMQDTTPITGTIESIVTETDANNVTTVLVTFVDEQGATQTVRLDLTTAAGLELVDETTLAVNDAMVGQSVTIDPATVIPGEEPVEEDVHPISWILANFFFKDDPEMASVIDSFHTGDNEIDQVFGFGVIAQALWMAKDSEGNTDIELAGDILQVKQDKDYEAFFEAHPELGEQFGDEIPSNWGQFKKVLKEKKNNLGTIVSGQADESTEDPALQENQGQQNQGNGNDKEKDKGKDKNKNKNKKKP